MRIARGLLWSSRRQAQAHTNNMAQHNNRPTKREQDLFISRIGGLEPLNRIENRCFFVFWDKQGRTRARLWGTHLHSLRRPAATLLSCYRPNGNLAPSLAIHAVTSPAKQSILARSGPTTHVGAQQASKPLNRQNNPGGGVSPAHMQTQRQLPLWLATCDAHPSPRTLHS